VSNRPAFQFYPADWRKNAKLRRCSPAARGAWMDILCVLHDSDEYGVCRWPLKDLANAAGVPMKLARELVEKDVLKGADANAPEYVFRPTHAGKSGDAVTLLVASEGPCWYCSRFVKDEYIRSRRGVGARFGDTPKNQPNTKPNTTPNQRVGDDLGDGPSSSSSEEHYSVVEVTERVKVTERASAMTRANSEDIGLQARIALCTELADIGITGATAMNASLISLMVQHGVSAEEVLATAREGLNRGIERFNWVTSTLFGRLADAQRQAHQAARGERIARATPSKTRGAIQKLEEIKREMAENGSTDWPAKTALSAA